jgi:hypothetical protein
MWSLMMRLVKDKAVSVHLCAYISFYDFYACFNLISWSILRLQIPKRSSSFCLCFVPVCSILCYFVELIITVLWYFHTFISNVCVITYWKSYFPITKSCLENVSCCNGHPTKDPTVWLQSV